MGDRRRASPRTVPIDAAAAAASSAWTVESGSTGGLPRERTAAPFRAAPVRVRVPATSANLGPGFDAFGLALGLYDDVVVRVTEAGLASRSRARAPTRCRRENGTWSSGRCAPRSTSSAGSRAGSPCVCANRIPHGRGLGSSAAAIVAGILAARALVSEGLNGSMTSDVLRLAASARGPPDNVAACLLGGFTVAWIEAAAASARSACRSAPTVVPVVLRTRPTQLATPRRAGCCPSQVPLADAARQRPGGAADRRR